MVIHTSHADYITRQKNLYYLTGESLAAARDLPFVEFLKYEVLLVGSIDEYGTQRI